MGRKAYYLTTQRVRQNAIEAVRDAPAGFTVIIKPVTRSLGQNDHFHALCRDLAASTLEWAGKRRSEAEWKMLMVSGHSVATGEQGEVIPGVEGEFVAIRESTARMGVARASSLIEYVTAFCVSSGVDLKETRHGGYQQEGEAA